MVFLLLFVCDFAIFHRTSDGRGYNPRDLPFSLLQSLQSSTAIYTGQQRVPPDVFTDFVQADGPTSGAMTLTLENVRSELSTEPEFKEEIMILKFKNGGTTTYYLNGTDVTASYEGF